SSDMRMIHQPQLGAELELDAPLAGPIAARIARADERVGLRAPQRVVDAVQDADEVVAARTKHGIEPHAELRRADLLGIAGAHRRHDARVADAELEKDDVVARAGRLVLERSDR